MNQDNEYKVLCSRRFLSRIRDRRMRIDALRIEIDSYRQLLAITSHDLDTRRSFNRVAERRIEKYLLASEQLIDQYELELNEYMHEIEEVHKTINRINPPWSEALRLHYLIGKPWREVSTLLNYSDRYIYNIHRAALIKLYDKLPRIWLVEQESLIPKAL